jgi:predicted acetyltransferase
MAGINLSFNKAPAAAYAFFALKRHENCFSCGALRLLAAGMLDEITIRSNVQIQTISGMHILALVGTFKSYVKTVSLNSPAL